MHMNSKHFIKLLTDVLCAPLSYFKKAPLHFFGFRLLEGPLIFCT